MSDVEIICGPQPHPDFPSVCMTCGGTLVEKDGAWVHATGHKRGLKGKRRQMTDEEYAAFKLSEYERIRPAFLEGGTDESSSDDGLSVRDQLRKIRDLANDLIMQLDAEARQ